MISSALVKAVSEIDHYLNDAYFRRHYEQAGVLTRIRLVRDAMEDLRQELEDAPDTARTTEVHTNQEVTPR